MCASVLKLVLFSTRPINDITRNDEKKKVVFLIKIKTSL